MRRPAREGAGRAASVLTALAAAAGLYLAFVELSTWARTVFARSLLASCLLAVLELALFLLAAALAPTVSLLVVKAMGLMSRRR